MGISNQFLGDDDIDAADWGCITLCSIDLQLSQVVAR